MEIGKEKNRKPSNGNTGKLLKKSMQEARQGQSNTTMKLVQKETSKAIDYNKY